MESNYSIGCFSGFHIGHSKTLDAIIDDQYPFKSIWHSMSLLLQADRNCENIVHVSPAASSEER